MRILHISTRLILGGSQENTVLSCEEQARRGHEVHLAFGPIYGPEGSLLERVQKFRTAGGSGITTHVVPHLVREINPIADLRCLDELEALIKKIRPDIVHTHSSKAGILGRRAAWGARNDEGGTDAEKRRRGLESPRPEQAHAGLGVVHTIHGPPFMPIEGGVLNRAKVRSLNHVYTMAERGAAKRCHMIVSVADAMTREFLRRGIGREDQYRTVRSGIEVEQYLAAAAGGSREDVRRELGLGAGDFVIGTVARLAQHKGHDDLLEALADDLKSREDWKLLWVGDGWWRERLIAKARGLGLAVLELDREPSAPDMASKTRPCHPAHILITGLVPPERIPRLIRAMDVLAHPSTREGLPRTVPQALLSGVCPVAYDVDGTGEACVEMRTGRLVSPGDRAGLRGAIRWCFEHPAERAALANAGRDMCRERYSVGAMVDGLERVYEEALRRA